MAALYSSVCEKRGSCPRAQVLHFPFLEKGVKIFCSDVGTAFSNQQDYDTCFPTALVDKGTPPTIVCISCYWRYNCAHNGDDQLCYSIDE